MMRILLEVKVTKPKMKKRFPTPVGRRGRNEPGFHQKHAAQPERSIYKWSEAYYMLTQNEPKSPPLGTFEQKREMMRILLEVKVTKPKMKKRFPTPVGRRGRNEPGFHQKHAAQPERSIYKWSEAYYMLTQNEPKSPPLGTFEKSMFGLNPTDLNQGTEGGVRVKLGSIKDIELISGWKYSPRIYLFLGIQNPKAIAHIRVASRIRTRVRRIEFIPPSTNGLPPLPSTSSRRKERFSTPVSSRVEHFRFRTHEQILELANTSRQLPDVIGEVRAIRSTITDRLPGAQRVMLTLRMESDVNVCVSLFDSLAVAFHTKLDGYGREPRIVLVYIYHFHLYQKEEKNILQQ
ncbi:hypothetical protein F2Q69_00031484 [Brassica cretica]|uniref:Uncharacterized protein n=1 Tax=Brassica cretica TaxID=69181 RepID=A0A8S9RYJ5_BRACR|nr:hypothetical protein F2Q69_00031484 [Brassica cretica]